MHVEFNYAISRNGSVEHLMIMLPNIDKNAIV